MAAHGACMIPMAWTVTMADNALEKTNQQEIQNLYFLLHGMYVKRIFILFNVYLILLLGCIIIIIVIHKFPRGGGYLHLCAT